MFYKDEDILRGKECPREYRDNLKVLLERTNKMMAAFYKDTGLPKRRVTSGLRWFQEQIEIYKKKGVFDLDKIPSKSKHFYCQALDIEDADGKLKEWILKNIRLVEDIGLWFEDFDYTKTWVHLQTVPPRSGKRFFIP